MTPPPPCRTCLCPLAEGSHKWPPPPCRTCLCPLAEEWHKRPPTLQDMFVPLAEGWHKRPPPCRTCLCPWRRVWWWIWPSPRQSSTVFSSSFRVCITCFRCFGSGSGAVGIRKFLCLPDPDPSSNKQKNLKETRKKKHGEQTNFLHFECHWRK